MLVSLKELNKYIDLSSLNAEQIASGLTFAGIEVEDYHSIANGTNLIIGEIIDCVAHPDSNHLHVLKVNLGEQEGIKQIVCGAPNARKGIKVIVAMVGAKLPQIEIKKSTIRGIDSEGMCCSLSELGVEAKYLKEEQLNGIEELPQDATIGNKDVLAYLGLDDTIFNLKILANRPDLLSIYNIARELGAIFSLPTNIPDYEDFSSFKSDFKIDSLTDKCLRFAGIEIKNVTIKDSPKWLKDFLMAEGVRSINNIVDIGNYVMLLTGQPLHMYDLDKLPNRSLIVKDDYNGPFIALDEQNYDVIKGDIVITSNNQVMCLGGVMGSLSCAVEQESKNIFIEAACFDGATIRHTSSRLGLSSESSMRFVKGTDHFNLHNVMCLVKHLIKDLADSSSCSEIILYDSEPYHKQEITINIDNINNILATSFTKQEISSVLDRLNFEYIDQGKTIKITIPSYRNDLKLEEDIAEEIIRLLGYENVKETLPRLDSKIGGLSLERKRLSLIRDYLIDIGLDECLTYSLVAGNEVDKFNLLAKKGNYHLLNPLTDEHEYYRNNILYSLLNVASYNIKRQNKSLRLFESGMIYTPSGSANHLAIVLSGDKINQGLLNVGKYDFYDMKGIVEEIFALFGIESSRYKFSANIKDELLHPGKSAEISFQGKIIGRFGEIYPTQYKTFDLAKNTTIVLEMDLDSILNAKISQIKASEYSKYPTVRRDIAFYCAKSIAAADLIKTIKLSGKGIVGEVDIFDVFINDEEPDKKSIAIRISFTNMDHTLTDKEIADSLDKIKYELAKSYNVEYRV